MEGFREHFGTEPRLRTTDGYSFLGRDKAGLGVGPGSGNSGNDLPQPKTEATLAGNGDSTSHAPSGLQTAVHGSAAGMRGMRPPPLAVVPEAVVAPAAKSAKSAKSTNAASGGDNLHGGLNQSESTLENLLDIIKSSATSRSGGGIEKSPTKLSTAAPVGITQSAVGGAGSGDLMRRLGKLVKAPEQGMDIDSWQSAKISVQIVAMDRLTDMQSMIQKSRERAARRRQRADSVQNGVQTSRTAVRPVDKDVAAKASTVSKELGARGVAKGSQLPRADADTAEDVAVGGAAAAADGSKGDGQARAGRGTKRPMPAEFIFQVQVPQLARRRVADVIVGVQVEKRKRRRAAEAADEDDMGMDVDLDGSSAAKRMRTLAAQDRVDRPYVSSDSGRAKPRRQAASATRARSPSEQRTQRAQADAPVETPAPVSAQGYRDTQAPVETPAPVSAQGYRQAQAQAQAQAPAWSTSGSAVGRAGGWVSEGELEALRRSSSRLGESMRSFKHIGDAERESGSTAALEIVSYLESMSCCLEDFWIRGAFNTAGDMHKNWHTMLNICSYLEAKCDRSEFTLLRGCAMLVSGSVHYQLATLELELAQQQQPQGEAAAAAVQRLAAAAARRLEQVEQLQHTAQGMVSARRLARQLPQMWQRCQESGASLGRYEVRSTPHTTSWPAVAYPVGAMSNPLDVANFVRQAGREWLSQKGLALRMPGRQGIAHGLLTQARQPAATKATRRGEMSALSAIRSVIDYESEVSKISQFLDKFETAAGKKQLAAEAMDTGDGDEEEADGNDDMDADMGELAPGEAQRRYAVLLQRVADRTSDTVA
ncbi:hypothetical protein IW150_005578, partial [Coemansia sp. RSA 2607]